MDAGAATGTLPDVLILPAFEDGKGGPALAAPSPPSVPARILLKSPDFQGRRDQTLVHHAVRGSSPFRIVLLGLGPRKGLAAETLRRAGAAAHRALGRGRTARFLIHGLDIDGGPGAVAEAVATGFALAAYRFDAYRKPGKDESAGPLSFVLEGPREGLSSRKAGVTRALVITDCVAMARDIANLPGNDAPPAVVAARARGLARAHDVRSRILGPAELRKLGMGALLAVARGSDAPPRILILEHGRGGRGRRTVCLVGKGITFDSGGISIKPSADMHKMKYDKSGGAAVIGTVIAAARLRIPLHVVGIVPLAENLPGGSATRPGDIVTASNGRTIEIQNTDAEGRLILADALVYARRFSPEVLIDIATLTGACAAALANQFSGLFGVDSDLLATLRAAGESSGERVWELPLTEEFREMVKGECSDLKNVGGKYGGASTAAAFLQAFVEKIPWVHLDIAGTAWDDGDRPYHRGKGATGVGVRLLVETLARLAAARRR